MTLKNHPYHSNEYNNQEPAFSDELARKLAHLKTMGRELGDFINGFQFKVDRANGEVKINLRKKTRPKVELVPLLRHLQVVHPLLSVLGWSGDQKPMVWSADNPQRHLLISGGPHAGKTGLLRSLVLTLVLASRPSKLQLVIVDGSCKAGFDYDHSELKKFSRLPHLLNRPPTNPAEVCEIVEFISKEADHRLKHKTNTPQILMVIDNVENILPVAGPTFHQQLEHILDIGPQTGIGVILATNRPEDGRLQDLIAGLKVDRIVGKVHSAGQAAFATGRDNSEAEYLDGNGEFLAVINDRGYHFHAAWVGEKHLDRYLVHASQPNQPTLLAWDLFDDSADYGDDVEEWVEEEPYEEVEIDEGHDILVEEEDQEDYEDDLEEIEVITQKPLSERPLRKVRQESIYTQLNNHWMTADAASNSPAAHHSEPEDGEPLTENDDEEEWDQLNAADDETPQEHPFEIEAEIEPIEEQEHQLGWKTLKPWAISEDDEPEEDLEDAEAEDDDFDLFDLHPDNNDSAQEEPVEPSAEEIDKQIRRSRLPKVKIASRSSFKPIPKPSAQESSPASNEENAEPDEVASFAAEISRENREDPTSETTEDTTSPTKNEGEPFDPWQSGLDETPPVLKNRFERPPRLAQKKTPKKVRRIARPSTVSREEAAQTEKDN